MPLKVNTFFEKLWMFLYGYVLLAENLTARLAFSKITLWVPGPAGPAFLGFWK